MFRCDALKCGNCYEVRRAFLVKGLAAVITRRDAVLRWITIVGGLLLIILPIAIQGLPLIIGCRGVVPDCWGAYWGGYSQDNVFRILIFLFFIGLGIAALTTPRLPKSAISLKRFSLVMISLLNLSMLYMVRGSIVSLAFMPGAFLLLIAAFLNLIW